MCTVSWIHHPGGYELFCNRDELRARKAALPPQVFKSRDVQVLAPRDGDFGGAWVSVNEFGLSLCLLNLYGAQAPKPVGPFTSRGLLLLDLADAGSLDQMAERIAATRVAQFQPFTLLALFPGAPALTLRWDGRELSTEQNGDRHLPLTSSSVDSGSVIESRRRQFTTLAASTGAVDADFLLGFHRSHTPEPGASSVCMHRADAETVSFSRLKVSSGLIEFQYFPHSPCRGGKAIVNVLPKTNR